MKRGRSGQNGNYHTILIGTQTQFETNIPRMKLRGVSSNSYIHVL
jgi:hypothetical protein